MMDTLLLSRLQFAVTIGFHFIFPPITIGLAWLLVVMEWRSWRSGGAVYERMGKFFAHLLAMTFVIGVASGIVMEFQFGTNWSEFSKFVGDIFGAPLAAEGVFAFFLESGFLGLYLFGRKRIPKGLHWFSCLMVAVGATISAFWILVAVSWMQTPTGYVIQNGRAELTSFAEAVFNPSMWVRFNHTMMSCLVAGSFFVAAVSALLLKKKIRDGLTQAQAAESMAYKSLRLGLIAAFISSLLVAFPTGHEHARQVARDQPEKFAAIEGLYTTKSQAPLVMFGLVKSRPPELKAKFEIPGLLSYMAFGDVRAEVLGLDVFPKENHPPLWITFVSFHNMVILGMVLILISGWGVLKLWRKNLWRSGRYLTLLVCAMPLAILAIEFGWVACEVGRQPWIVYHELRTSEAFSATVPAGQVLFSLIMFAVIYLLLFCLYLFLLRRQVRAESEAEVIVGGGH